MADVISAALYDTLQPLLEPDFVVNCMPQLQGRWPTKLNRFTLSQQAVGFGMISVQLELSLRLRQELNSNRTLRRRVAHALVGALDQVWDSGIPLISSSPCAK